MLLIHCWLIEIGHVEQNWSTGKHTLLPTHTLSLEEISHVVQNRFYPESKTSKKSAILLLAFQLMSSHYYVITLYHDKAWYRNPFEGYKINKPLLVRLVYQRQERLMPSKFHSCPRNYASVCSFFGQSFNCVYLVNISHLSWGNILAFFAGVWSQSRRSAVC